MSSNTILSSISPSESQSYSTKPPMPNIIKNAKDERFQSLLERVFTSDKIKLTWANINRNLTFEAKIIPLSAKDCQDRFKAHSSMKPVLIDDKISTIQIFYDNEMDDTTTMRSLIFEIMNASLARRYVDTFKLVSEGKTTEKEDFASQMETIRWRALTKSSKIFNKMGLDEVVDDHLKIFDNLNAYLEEQKKNGHTEHYMEAFNNFQKTRKSHLPKLSITNTAKKINLEDISRDTPTQVILSKIFNSVRACYHWEEACKLSSLPIRVIPLSQEECYNRFQSRSSMEPTIIDGKLTSIRIFYDKEMLVTQAMVALMIEIMNASFADRYLSIYDSVTRGEITTSEEFADSIERLEWLAMNMSLSIIKELGLEEVIKDDLEQFNCLDVYLEQQRKMGHTDIYEKDFLKYQRKLVKSHTR